VPWSHALAFLYSRDVLDCISPVSMSVTIASYGMWWTQPGGLLTLPFLTLQSEAKIQVNRVRPKWVKWEREYEDDEVSHHSNYSAVMRYRCLSAAKYSRLPGQFLRTWIPTISSLSLPVAFIFRSRTGGGFLLVLRTHEGTPRSIHLLGYHLLERPQPRRPR
jgi:hypothetical protein